MKILGIGLPKTGTTSLAHELNRRGIRTLHGPYPQRLNFSTFDEQMNECAKFDALLEWQCLWPMRKVIDRFPEAIIVNTVRPYDKWIDSCQRHFRRSPSPRVRKGRTVRFGVPFFKREAFDKLYELHIQDISKLLRDGIKVRNLYITEGDDLSILDAIVSTDVDREPFPHKRKGRRRV